MRKAVRADVSHLALSAILAQKVSRKAGLGGASISKASIHGVRLTVSAPASQPDPSKELHPNPTASLAAVPAVPSKDQCILAMDQGIPARDQGISIKDPGSTTEVKGSCIEDQGIPAEAQHIPSKVVLMSQPAPAAVDCVLAASADDSSVSAGVEAHQGGVSPSSAGQAIAD